LKAFSLGEAKKKQLASIQFILALCCASIIASSTISIQTKSDQIQFFSKLIHIVHVQQYRSNMVHFTYHNISCAFENNFCAQNVFVWKKENGDILNVVSVLSARFSFNINNSCIYPSHRNVLLSEVFDLTVSASQLL
jgi:hypothetical protein